MPHTSMPLLGSTSANVACNRLLKYWLILKCKYYAFLRYIPQIGTSLCIVHLWVFVPSISRYIVSYTGLVPVVEVYWWRPCMDLARNRITLIHKLKDYRKIATAQQCERTFLIMLFQTITVKVCRKKDAVWSKSPARPLCWSYLGHRATMHKRYINQIYGPGSDA